jgi:hypothetical protein
MKQAKTTLDKIRGKTTSFQKALFEHVWQQYRTTGLWPILRELYSYYGKQEVDKAIKALGNGIGHTESSGSRWERYRLSLLGVLLTKDGSKFEGLLERFFQYQRDLFKNQPQKEMSTSAEIATAVDLTPDQTKLLGELLWLGSFGGGRNNMNDEWNVSVMEEAADFPQTGDLFAEVSRRVCRYYQAHPVSSKQSPLTFEFPEAQLSGTPSSDPTGQPQILEIAASLDRLKKRFPDQAKLGFLIMRFGDGKPYEQIVCVIRQAAESHGLMVVRADEIEFHAHLWENIRTYLHGCSFGIAIYERIQGEEQNANVGLEVGYLLAMNKPVLIFKDKTVKALQSDLAGKLYKNFDPHDPDKTIPKQLTSWLADKGIIVPSRSEISNELDKDA